MNKFEKPSESYSYEFPKARPKLRKFFGDELLNQLEELAKGSIVEEIDAMIHDGDISRELASEYGMHLPEYHQLRRDVRYLSDEFAKHMGKKLPRYFERIFNEDGSINPKAFDKHFVGLRRLLIDLMDAYSTKDKVTGWNGRMLEFWSFLDQSLALFLADFARRHFKDSRARIHASWQVRDVCKRTPHIFTGEAGEKSPHHLAVSGLDTMTHLSQFHPWEEAERGLREYPLDYDVEDLFSEAEDLTQFRKLNSVALNVGQYKFIVGTQYHDRPGVRSQYMATVLIQDRSDQSTVLQLSVCRSTGDLFVPTTNVCLGSFMNVESYQSLRIYLFDLICKELRGKPEDIESNVPVVTREIEEIHEEIRETLPEEEQPKVISFPKEKSRPTFNLSRLRNLSSSKVHRALTRLLGPPVRIRGSHHFFRTRNGDAHPISLHRGRTVKTGLLRACIHEMGLDPLEFYEAL